MLTAHQRIRLAEINLLLQIELVAGADPDDLLDSILEMLNRDTALEGNA